METIWGVGCSDEGAAGVTVAADHVEDAFGEELGGKLGEHDGRDRGGVGGFYDDGVAGGDGGGELPDGPSSSGSSRALPGRKRRPARGG